MATSEGRLYLADLASKVSVKETPAEVKGPKGRSFITHKGGAKELVRLAIDVEGVIYAFWIAGHDQKAKIYTIVVKPNEAPVKREVKISITD